jgi:integration host factor subunit beta
MQDHPVTGSKLTRAALVDQVAEAAGLTKKGAEVIVVTVLDNIAEALRRGEKVELRGFGSFRLRQRGPRTGRNPKTGELVDVPSKSVPYFKPGKELKALLERELRQACGGVAAGLATGRNPERVRKAELPLPERDN